MPSKFSEGCAPRITVLKCGSVLADQVKVGKIMTLVSQISCSLLLLYKVVRCREHRTGVSGQAHAIVLITLFLGIFHSVVFIIPYPDKLGDDTPLVIIELSYSLFNACLVGALGMLNRIWIENYIPPAFPGQQEILKRYQQATCIGSWGLVAACVIVALASDAIFAAVQTYEAFDTAVHIQHWAFASLCVVTNMACILGARRLFREARQCAFTIPVDGNPELHSLRMKVSGITLAFLWTYCATFCGACAVLGALLGPVDPAGTAARLAWVTHAAFVFTGGNGAAFVLTVLLHSPGYLDMAACLCCFKVPKDAQAKDNPEAVSSTAKPAMGGTNVKPSKQEAMTDL